MIFLSPSKLNTLNNCPRCFWFENKVKFARPRGIFPTLPGGMDLIMKKFLDAYRGSMPVELRDKLPGVLYPDAANLKAWRNWRTCPTYVDEKLGVTLRGALDDCLLETIQKLHSPLDYKTKGSKPKDSGAQYYQTQVDSYDLMLNFNGFATSGYAYLAYFYPVEAVSDLGVTGLVSETLQFQFGVDVYKLECSQERIKKLLTKAMAILAEDKAPEPALNCDYCNYIQGAKDAGWFNEKSIIS